MAALADEASHLVRVEGGWRADFAISTTHFVGRRPRPRDPLGAEPGVPPSSPFAGTEESRPAELVLLAMGFRPPGAPLPRLARCRSRRTRKRRGARLRDVRRRGLRGRRCPQGTVSDRVGDRRRATVCERGQQPSRAGHVTAGAAALTGRRRDGSRAGRRAEPHGRSRASESSRSGPRGNASVTTTRRGYL